MDKCITKSNISIVTELEQFSRSLIKYISLYGFKKDSHISKLNQDQNVIKDIIQKFQDLKNDRSIDYSPVDQGFNL